MFQRILIAVDENGPAEYAARSGIDLAGTLGAEVALVTVLPRPATVVVDMAAMERNTNAQLDRAQRLFTRYRTRLPKDTPVKQIIAEGSAGEEIVEAPRNWHAELIVLGTHNRRGLSRVLVGSTAQHVVRNAPCPVLVVPPVGHATSDECKTAVDVLQEA